MLMPKRVKYRKPQGQNIVVYIDYLTKVMQKVILNYTMELTDLWQWKVLG